MDPRARLLTKIFDQGFRTPDWRHKMPPPVVTLEDFFEDNSRPRCIAANLHPWPGLDFFYRNLQAIRSEPEVHTVLVNIYDLSEIVFNLPEGWPYAENIHILTCANEVKVNEWATRLRADGAVEGWPYGRPELDPDPPGYRWWSIAWD